MNSGFPWHWLLPHFLLVIVCWSAAQPREVIAQPSQYGSADSNPSEKKTQPAVDLPSRLRRPVAMAFSEDEKWLYVANRRSGTVSAIDLAKKQVVAEVSLGRQLSDLTSTFNPNIFLATDESQHQLLLLHAQGPKIKVVQRLSVAKYPVNVVVSRDGLKCYVTSLWSRRLTFVDLPTKKHSQAMVAGILDLPFAPRIQLLVKKDSRLIVADSFGGELGIIATDSKKLLFERSVPGHNIRGLAKSNDGKMLLVAHQMLNELAHTVRNDVHWGLLMSNDLRWLRLDAVLDPSADLYKGAHMHPLGEAGNATADPGGIATAENGTVVVALSGVNEISLGVEKDFSLQRLQVGKRPTAVTISRDSRSAYVANTFDDSITAIDLQKRAAVLEISLGPMTPLTLADRGELLFHDARLSHDGWMTCQSCHPGGHTNSMLNDNFSDASFGAPKRVLSLLGKADTAPFAWLATANSFEEQIRKSIFNTMQSDREPSEKQVTQLAAFLRTLQLPPSIDEARDKLDGVVIARGQALFESQKCNRCHAPPTFTTSKTYDVGLKDKLGNKRFNPPSLRGVSQRGSYFHDGRANSLDEVLRKYRHQLKGDLRDSEIEDLKAYLRSL